jgi:putative alpha-1,2-mannosidase
MIDIHKYDNLKNLTIPILSRVLFFMLTMLFSNNLNAQSINEGKKIVLVTRHANDLAVTLAQHRLTNLFDDVFHLREEEPKSRYITSKDAIFIDDSFRERKEVARVCGIPTFDCSMLEVLTNHRI